ncbi:thymidylate kinase [Actinoplanes palleronii]|nr:thymidylate kinase [Actinoplanes palleronii]
MSSPEHLAPGRPGDLAGPRTIALVGIDGSGKTTQARLLAAELAATGLPAVYRQNAGGRAWFGKRAVRWGRPDADALLGRRGMLLVESVLRWLSIVRTLLRRALRREIAVMDRYAFCQYASLRARGARPAAERRARLAYRLFPHPDVTFLLAVDPAVAQERIDRRGTDQESMEYLTAADRAYRSLPEFPEFVVIDANGTPDQVSAAIRAGLAAATRPAAPAPRRIRVRTLVLAGVPVLAGAAVLGWQLAESL